MTPEQIAQENRKAAEVMGWVGENGLPRQIEFVLDMTICDEEVKTTWSPMTDPSDAHRLMMRMVELGYYFCFWGGPRELFTVVFQPQKNEPGYLIKSKIFTAALTQAANKAWEAREK